MSGFVLVSHPLCPYVQRVAIALIEKGVRFERETVDLAEKPDWFLALSPLGKTPVLIVDGTPVFESAVILEYLEDTVAPPLHPADPLARARDRGFVEFGSEIVSGIGALYGAADEAAFASRRAALDAKFARIETEVAGPWFAGDRFGLVDAAFGPVFRYLDALDRIPEAAGLAARPALDAWRRGLAGRPSVRDAVAPDYPARLWRFLEARPGHIGRLAALLAAPT